MTREGFRLYTTADRDLDVFLSGASPQELQITQKDPERGSQSVIYSSTLLTILFCTSSGGTAEEELSVAIGYGLEHGAFAIQ